MSTQQATARTLSRSLFLSLLLCLVLAASVRPAHALLLDTTTGAWRGPWVATGSYSVNDLVSYNGGIYINIAATAPTTVTTNTGGGTNRFDKSAITEDAVVLSGNGSLAGIGGFETSGYVNVAGSSFFVTNITINIFSPYGIAFFDANKRYVGGSLLNGNGYYTSGYPVPVPSGATYVRFWWQDNVMGTNLANAVVDTGTTLQTSYTSFNVSSGNGTAVTTSSPAAAPSDTTHWSSLGAGTGGPWAGKKMFLLADSIIWQNPAIATSLANAVGATLSNHGATAPGIDAFPGRTFDQFRNGSTPLSAAVLADVDLMVIALGTNQDSGAGLGSINDSPSLNGTMSAQMRYMIETVLAYKPGMRVVVVGPYQSNRYNVQAGPDGLLGTQDTNKTLANAGSITVLRNINNQMKAICGLYSVPYIDMYNGSGVNFSTSNLWLTDGLHPNATGYTAFYVPYIAAQLSSFH